MNLDQLNLLYNQLVKLVFNLVFSQMYMWHARLDVIFNN